MPKNTFKKILGKIHLWLGLTTGLVVFFVSLTGAIYVFQEEINLLLQAGVYKNVEPQNKPFISPLSIKEKTEDYFRNKITYMNATVFPKGDRATIVWVKDSTRKYTAIVQNPYTGEVIHSFPYNINFWAVILSLHVSLLIPEIGHHIVSISTIVFIILMISGLILWYPKSKKGFKQRFSIKWGASPKRVNYDLHNVLGFYMTWLAIFIAHTGLVMSYDWMKNSIYFLATVGESPIEQEKITSDIKNKTSNQLHQVEVTLLTILSDYENPDNYYLEYAIDSTSCYNLTVNTKEGFLYNRHDTYLIDQYSGKILKKDLWTNKNNGERLQEANLNIHTGAIGSFPGKIVAFFASLIAASLPITGFLIWKGRRKKEKKAKK